jgi:hypothetical protein
VKHPHGRFEALAGAILLDEATAADRAEFALHAESCAVCREDAAAFTTPLRGSVEAVAQSETWRPSMTDEILERIHERHTKRTRFTITTIGYAVVASIVLNVAFVSGFGGRAIDALRITPRIAYSATQPIRIEHRPKVALVVNGVSALVGPRRAALAAVARKNIRPASQAAASDDIGPPDVFDGLRADESGARNVAAGYPPVCAADLERVAVRPEPCRSMPAERR